jgi:hypothetical protein
VLCACHMHCVIYLLFSFVSCGHPLLYINLPILLYNLQCVFYLHSECDPLVHFPLSLAPIPFNMTAQVTALTMILPAVLTQKRTREVTKGVAGYATTTGVLRPRIIRWKTHIFPILYRCGVMMGESA